MNIAVMNRARAEEYAINKHENKTIVISISNCGQGDAFIIPNNVSNIVDVLHLKFNDTESSSLIDGGMTKEDARKIKEFVDRHMENKDFNSIIVHCGAGQSRSAGVAAALHVYLNGNDRPIFNNRQYTPNMWCYRLLLNETMGSMFNEQREE